MKLICWWTQRQIQRTLRVSHISFSLQPSAFSTHVSSCSSCRHAAETAEWLNTVHPATALPEPSADLASRIMERIGALEGIRSQPARNQTLAWWTPLRIGMACSGLIILAVGFHQVWNPTGDPPNASQRVFSNSKLADSAYDPKILDALGGYDAPTDHLQRVALDPSAEPRSQRTALDLLANRSKLPSVDQLLHTLKQQPNFWQSISYVLATRKHDDPRVYEHLKQAFQHHPDPDHRERAAQYLEAMDSESHDTKGRDLLIQRLDQLTDAHWLSRVAENPSARRTWEYDLLGICKYLGNYNVGSDEIRTVKDRPAKEAFYRAAARLIASNVLQSLPPPSSDKDLMHEFLHELDWIEEPRDPRFLSLLAAALERGLIHDREKEDEWAADFQSSVGIKEGGKEDALLWWKWGLAVRPFTEQDLPTLNPLAASMTQEAPTGIIVASVQTGGLAEKAGLKPGDRIERIETAPAGNTPADFWTTVNAFASGSSVKLTVRRAGSSRQIFVSLP